jgi:hypothetical protein
MSEKNNMNIACRLTTPELQQRKRTVIAELKSLVLERTEIVDGVRYSFKDTDDIISLLTDFIKTERLCCPFFVFNLTVGQQEGLITLQLSGPQGTKEFIETEIGF